MNKASRVIINKIKMNKMIKLMLIIIFKICLKEQTHQPNMKSRSIMNPKIYNNNNKSYIKIKKLLKSKSKKKVIK